MFSTFSKLVRFLLYGGALFFVVILSLANRDTIIVSLHPLPYEVSLPTFLLILLVFLAGFLFGGLYTASSRWRTTRQHKKEQAHIQALEHEVASLRAERRSESANNTDTETSSLPVASERGN